MHYSGFSIVTYGVLSVPQERKRKLKNPIVFFLVRSRATCTCEMNASYGLKHYIKSFFFYLVLPIGNILSRKNCPKWGCK